MNASASVPSAFRTAVACSARRRPDPDLRRPEAGLMRTATRTTSAAGATEEAGRSEPDEVARAAGTLEIDPAHATLLEGERPPGANEARGQQSEIGLVADAGDPRPSFRATSEVLD